MRAFIFAVLLLIGAVRAESFVEIKTASGSDLVVVENWEMAKFPVKAKNTCNRYAFTRKGEKYEPFSNGIGKIPAEKGNGVTFMVRDGCYFPRSGRLQLTTGKWVDFYKEDFAGEGDLAFVDGTVTPLSNGTYELKKDKVKFQILSGRIQELGEICSGGESLCFPERD
jgi:hypothetical protein